MTDMVERLRMKTVGAYLGGGKYEANEPTPLATEAADEIERIRSLLREAGGSLQRLYHYHRGCHEDEDAMEPSASDWADAWEQARATLSKTKGEA